MLFHKRLEDRKGYRSIQTYFGSTVEYWDIYTEDKITTKTREQKKIKPHSNLRIYC